MKTQQAHSPHIEDKAAARSYPFSVWLNLVCLDAPLVAIAWLSLFARSFQVPLQIGNGVALFLTAWLIYLAERFADALSLKPNSPRSLRQEFCLRHREIWIATVILVGGFDAYVIERTIAWETFVVGAVVGTLALIYLVLNHPLGLIWRTLPAKELAIGMLFAAGTVGALLPWLPMTTAFAVATVSFAALCALNCISIAAWERELDRAQGKVSIATRRLHAVRSAAKICGVLSVAAFVLAVVFPLTAPIFACIGVSALLLSSLNASPRVTEARFFNRPRRLPNGRFFMSTDQRTALADLVLLTPIVALIVMSL